MVPNTPSAVPSAPRNGTLIFSTHLASPDLSVMQSSVTTLALRPLRISRSSVRRRGARCFQLSSLSRRPTSWSALSKPASFAKVGLQPRYRDCSSFQYTPCGILFRTVRKISWVWSSSRERVSRISSDAALAPTISSKVGNNSASKNRSRCRSTSMPRACSALSVNRRAA